MAEDRYTRAELLALFPDNTTRQIQAVASRALLTGAGLKGFGSIVFNSYKTVSISLSTAWADLTSWDANGDSDAEGYVSPGFGSNKITLTEAGTYLLHANLSVSLTNLKLIAFQLSNVPGSTMYRDFSGGTDIGVFCITSILPDAAAGTEITAQAKTLSGVATVDRLSGGLSAVRIG